MANIVVIDDDRRLVDEMCRTLEGSGHSVQAAENGHRGIELIEASLPDLVVTELLMPEKEGIETIVELSERFPAVPVVAMAGSGRIETEGSLLDARMLGAADTLAKPFTMDQFLGTVERLLSAE